MILRLILLTLFLSIGSARAETPSNGRIAIETGCKTLEFDVEIADEPNERSRGLMFRTELEDNAGMLFIYPSPRIASFWMKNTPLSLDILFIDAGGQIVNIASNTTPFSLESVLSIVPVTQILEIEGGDAKRLGIAVGDRMKRLDNLPAK